MSEPGRPKDEDRLLDHEYDGIREYDNPLPRWWVWIFWATILYSALYLLNVPGIGVIPGIGVGPGRIATWERDVAEARERAAQAAPKQEVTDEALRALAALPHELAEGRTQFELTCAPCHLADGGGSIGPNLCDAYVIHGGRPMDLYRTVHDGVPDKGMPAWSQVLTPDQLASVVAYVLTLRGTTPAQPKGPQGMNDDSVAAAARGRASP
jgi:cytochrome c oxidase cbb3-type subunit 3